MWLIALLLPLVIPVLIVVLLVQAIANPFEHHPHVPHEAPPPFNMYASNNMAAASTTAGAPRFIYDMRDLK